MWNKDNKYHNEHYELIEKLVRIVESEGLDVRQAQAIFEECARTVSYMYVMFFLPKLQEIERN